MRLSTVAEMQKIDQLAQSHHGLPGAVLMETAGQAAVLLLVSKYSSYLRNIVIIIGPGNNGGDGLVIARALQDQGCKNVKVIKPLSETVDNSVLESATIVIDALFGIGLTRTLDKSLIDLIEKLNSLDTFRFSVDVPSGLNADTGLPMGTAFKAHATITFGLSKVGFHIQEGPEYTGKLTVQNIGFPQTLLEQQATSCELFEKLEAKKLLKPESTRTNKVKRGRLLVIAGSKDFWGAGLLTCQMALRAGVGYVYWASFESPLSQLPQQPEVIVKNLSEISDFPIFDAIVIGPGLGVSKEAYDLVKKINNKKVIVDADALNSLAKFGVVKLNPDWVVTPHTGELARLLNVKSEAIEADRLKYLTEAQKKISCHVLLKGFHSQLCVQGKTYVVDSGNKALAKAGSGDVLAGLMGAFAAQDYSTIDAALLATYIHGAIADRWVSQGKSARSLAPSDLKDELAFVLQDLEREI